MNLKANNVVPFDRHFEPNMNTPISEIQAEVRRRGWSSFRIEFDRDKSTLRVTRIANLTSSRS